MAKEVKEKDLTVVDLPPEGEGDASIVEVEKKTFDPNEYLKNRFGEDTPAEEYESKLEEMFSKNDEYGKNMETMESIFGQDHMLEQVILNMKDGLPFSVALAKAGFTPDDFPVEGDDDYASYMEELNGRKEKSSAHQARLDELMTNGEGTNIAFAEIKKELYDGDDEGSASFADFIKGLATMFNSNKMSGDDMKNLHRYMNIDKLIEDAMEEGRISGSNASIAAKKAKAETGDEIPDLTVGEVNLENPEEDESMYRGDAVKF